MISRMAYTSGLVLVAAALAVLLWPLKGAGVTGNALRPHYVAFAWASYEPLPKNATTADLRAAGVVVPPDLVSTRRREAAALGVLGLVVVVAGGALSWRRRSEQPPS